MTRKTFGKFRRHRTTLISLTLLMISGFAWGNAFYIHAKAKLAQYLIADAWERSLQSNSNIKPWPWADTWPVARFVSKERKQDLYVLAGSSGSSLAFGPGHLDGTVLPGELGATVIGGHRDTHFTFLEQLQVGELLYMQDKQGQWHSYEITELAVEDSRDSGLVIAHEANELILVTCYPFDAYVPGGPLRYVVRSQVHVMKM